MWDKGGFCGRRGSCVCWISTGELDWQICVQDVVVREKTAQKMGTNKPHFDEKKLGHLARVKSLLR